MPKLLRPDGRRVGRRAAVLSAFLAGQPPHDPQPTASRGRDGMQTRKTKTLVITHDHCALHLTRKSAPERPKRLEWVMNALKSLGRDIQRDLGMEPLDIKEVKTSEPMFAALIDQLVPA